MNPQEFSDLLWLIAVIDQQSFSKAAKKLGVSKSVVSKHITSLEKTLGVQLLTRTTRKLALTEAGQLIYQHLTRIEENLNHIKQLAYSQHEVPQGKLRINAPFSFGQRHLMPAVIAFMEKYPEVRIEVLFGSYFSELIHDGVDLAISLKESSNENLIARKIATHRIHICASPDYLKKRGTPKTPAELLQHNCIVHQTLEASKPWWFLDAHHQKLEVAVSGNFAANSSQALLQAALSGMGIVKLSSYLVKEAISQGKLVSLLESYCPNEVGIYILRAPTSYLPQKVRVFVDFLMEWFEKSDQVKVAV